LNPGSPEQGPAGSGEKINEYSKTYKTYLDGKPKRVAGQSQDFFEKTRSRIARGKKTGVAGEIQKRGDTSDRKIAMASMTIDGQHSSARRSPDSESKRANERIWNLFGVRKSPLARSECPLKRYFPWGQYCIKCQGNGDDQEGRQLWWSEGPPERRNPVEAFQTPVHPTLQNTT